MGEEGVVAMPFENSKDSLNDLGFFNSCDWMS